MTKRIVLCADDYGQASHVSEGIKNLIQQGRLSATTCLVNSPDWNLHAKWLLPFKDQIDIGLHVNLTQGEAISSHYRTTYGKDFISLPRLILKTYLHHLDQTVIEAECTAQVERFIDVIGFPPRFIDGHQHIHQFPLIRQALINVYQRSLRQYKPYVRLVQLKVKITDLLASYKKLIINALVRPQQFRSLLIEHHIPHNHSFSGVYSFTQKEHFKTLFPIFLNDIEDNGLIMCHPGLKANTGDDPIANARFDEYQYLASDQFIEDCKRQSIVLSKFST